MNKREARLQALHAAATVLYEADQWEALTPDEVKVNAEIVKLGAELMQRYLRLSGG